MPGGNRFRFAAGAAILVAVAVAYGNALGADLVFDSLASILDDPRVHVWEWDRVRDLLTQDHVYGYESNLYRPLTNLSLAFNYAVLGNGGHAAGYVLLNLGLHAANAMLVLALARLAGLPRGAALLAGLVFAVHPAGTEAVTNAMGRADLLAATGVLAGVLLHARIARAGRFRPGLAAGLALASALAIGSKEAGIALVGVLVLHDAVLDPPRGRLGPYLLERLARSYAWCLAPLVPYFALRSVALAGERFEFPAPDNPLLLLGPLLARWNAAGILVRYLGLVLWPARLSADYSYDAIPLFDGSFRSVSDGVVVLAGPLLLFLVLAAFARRRRWPGAAFLGLFFFVTIAPVSNVFVLVGTILAERCLYLPMAGPIALLAWGAYAACERLRRSRAGALGVAALAVLLLGTLAARTAARNRDWRSGVALFRSAIEVCPRSFRVHHLYAGELLRYAKDDAERRARIDEVLAHTETAREILRELPSTYGFAALLGDLGRRYQLKAALAPEEAATWLGRAEGAFEQAVTSDQAAGFVPGWRLHLGLAEVRRDLGRTEEAVASFERAAALAPGPEVVEPYARLLAAAGRSREALPLALRAITLRPEADAGWELVRDLYRVLRPGAPAVGKAGDQWVLNTEDPDIARDLREAVRRQVEALARIDAGRGVESYREGVRESFGEEAVSGTEGP